jgi:hypothetical protein
MHRSLYYRFQLLGLHGPSGQEHALLAAVIGKAAGDPEGKVKTMKTLTTNLMIAAVALAVAAGTASAQTMKADIPFAFQTGRKAMPAGTYRISMDASKGIVSLLSGDRTSDVLLLATYRIGETKMSGPKLVFSCVAGSCSLTQAWSGEPGFNYGFASPKVSHKNAVLLEIRMHQ